MHEKFYWSIGTCIRNSSNRISHACAALCWTFIGSAVLCYAYAAYVILCGIALMRYARVCVFHFNRDAQALA